jgi:hypothetical protein
MPSGIILSSGSQGATKEAIEKVLTENGYEAETPAIEETTTELVEPKRDDFASDEEFDKAQEAHEAKLEEQEQAEAEKEEEAERKRLEALPKKSRKQRAVEKATKELNDKLRKAEERLAALEGKTPQGKEKTAAASAVEAPKAPKREDFDSDEKFEDALFDYRYKLRRATEAAEEAKKSLDSRLEQNFTDYKTAVASFKEEHDDWDEVVDQSLALPEAVYYAVVDLGKEGPPVTYYLGQHPEFLEELAELTPYRAAAEIGRLAEKLNPKAGKKPAAGAERTPKPKPRANIPEPVRPVSSSATSSSQTSREAAGKRDYRAFKAAQRRGA